MIIQDIGLRIKQLRLELGLTQEQLANRCELTKGFISQLENNIASPSIATLDNILEVLGTNLSDFFNDGEENANVYGEEDFYIKYVEEFKHEIRWIVPNAQKYEMEPIIIELEPGGISMKDKPHSGEEFGYVLQGEVQLVVGKQKYTVKQGNSFYYIANKEHYLKNITDRNALVLWVSTPPMF
jgi:transcriptional regulator with XRE-family HTH domain